MYLHFVPLLRILILSFSFTIFTEQNENFPTICMLRYKKLLKTVLEKHDLQTASNKLIKVYIKYFSKSRVFYPTV